MMTTDAIRHFSFNNENKLLQPLIIVLLMVAHVAIVEIVLSLRHATLDENRQGESRETRLILLYHSYPSHLPSLQALQQRVPPLIIS
ncbi:hypothetical protein [Undibacterium sp. RuRC25W]|uniref:hypothetical protein n=1 Tax=Undibacterium sp. RuRC25W TaxID=3413047 RepID=UPI003BF51053